MPDERKRRLPPIAPFQDMGVRGVFRAWEIDVDDFDDVKESAQHYRWSKAQWKLSEQHSERRRLNRGRLLAAALTMVATPLVGLAIQAFLKWRGWG